MSISDLVANVRYVRKGLKIYAIMSGVRNDVKVEVHDFANDLSESEQAEALILLEAQDKANEQS